MWSSYQGRERPDLSFRKDTLARHFPASPTLFLHFCNRLCGKNHSPVPPWALPGARSVWIP